MDASVKRRSMEEQIMDEIKGKSFLKAIQLLSTAIKEQKKGPVDPAVHMKYLLLRSYCYHRLAREDALELAYEDVMSAIDIDDRRFQSYLQGALILLDLNRLEESLQMLEKSIEINGNLFIVLVNKLIYLKFKILIKYGFDEQLSLKMALNYRYLEECMANIDSEPSDDDAINILPLILDFNHTNNNNNKRSANDMPFFDNFYNCNNFINSCPFGSNAKQRSFSEVVSVNDFNSVDEYCERWRPLPSGNDLSRGDQQTIAALKRSNADWMPSSSADSKSNALSNHLANESLKSTTLSIHSNDDNESDKSSLDLEFKDILSSADDNPHPNGKRKTSVQSWIDGSAGSKANGISMLCNFERQKTAEDRQSTPIPPPKTSSPKTTTTVECQPEPNRAYHTRVTTRGVTLSVTPVVDFGWDMSPKRPEVTEPAVKTMPTNIHKLRGLYIGNLKTNCDHKVLRGLFNVYGTILDLYQPSGVNYAFIHYKIHNSATLLVHDWQCKPLSECRDNKSVVLRFVASQDQMFKYNSMSYSEYKKRCNDASECERWRSGQHCPYDKHCPFKHIPSCRAIDTLPEKRKSGWKLK